jgi:hypothetical protein
MNRSPSTPSADHPWRESHLKGWNKGIDEILRDDHLGDAVDARYYFAERRRAVRREPRVPFRYSVENCPQWIQDVWVQTKRKDPTMTKDEFRMLMLVTVLNINLPRKADR